MTDLPASSSLHFQMGKDPAGSMAMSKVVLHRSERLYFAWPLLGLAEVCMPACLPAFNDHLIWTCAASSALWHMHAAQLLHASQPNSLGHRSSDLGAYYSSAEMHSYHWHGGLRPLPLLSHATVLQAHWVLDLICAPSLDNRVIRDHLKSGLRL